MTQQTLFNTAQHTYTTDDYYTPRWIFDALGVTFDIDVASPPGGPPHTPCHKYYTQEDDGLQQEWHGLVWMNPPYSKPAPWVDKFIEHANGIALLPYSKSKWLQKLWDSQASLLYVYTIKFERIDYKINGSTPFALGMWALGDRGVQALHDSKLGRVR